jgi:hypothetical protein
MSRKCESLDVSQRCGLHGLLEGYLYLFKIQVVLVFRFKLCNTFPHTDRLCGPVVRVLGYRSGGPGSIPGTTRKKISGSGTGSTQPRENN